MRWKPGKSAKSQTKLYKGWCSSGPARLCPGSFQKDLSCLNFSVFPKGSCVLPSSIQTAVRGVHGGSAWALPPSHHLPHPARKRPTDCTCSVCYFARYFVHLSFDVPRQLVLPLGADLNPIWILCSASYSGHRGFKMPILSCHGWWGLQEGPTETKAVSFLLRALGRSRGAPHDPKIRGSTPHARPVSIYSPLLLQTEAPIAVQCERAVTLSDGTVIVT